MNFSSQNRYAFSGRLLLHASNSNSGTTTNNVNINNIGLAFANDNVTTNNASLNQAHARLIRQTSDGSNNSSVMADNGWDLETVLRASALLAQQQNRSNSPITSAFPSLPSGHNLGEHRERAIVSPDQLRKEFSAVSENSRPAMGNQQMNQASAPTFPGLSASAAVAAPSEGAAKQPKKSTIALPRRPLSAYNIFFSEQRQAVLDDLAGIKKDDTVAPKKAGDELPPVLQKSFFSVKKKRVHRKVHGKIGLVSLARLVSKRWRELPDDERKYYQDLAKQDKESHKKAMEYYQQQKALEEVPATVQCEQRKPHVNENVVSSSMVLPNTNMVATNDYLHQALLREYQQLSLVASGMGLQNHLFGGTVSTNRSSGVTFPPSLNMHQDSIALSNLSNYSSLEPRRF